jgi:hypothetical protein
MRKRLVVILAVILITQSAFSNTIPVTGISESSEGLTTTPTRELLPYLNLHSLLSTARNISRAVVKNVFSFQVVEQPSKNPGYVSSAENTLTRFRIAEKYGSIGLLAHNHLAGAKFFELSFGDQIDLYGNDKNTQAYWVVSIRKFQALNPTSAYSDFIDLESGLKYSASELFLEIYSRPDLLILQTCLKKGEVDSWGRIFVIAQPDNPHFYRPWIQGSPHSLTH